MEMCLGRFEAETEEELWKHIELHASVAHKEDPASWPSEERAKVKALIKKIERPA
jgi:predicted small metal-binding protein